MPMSKNLNFFTPKKGFCPLCTLKSAEDITQKLLTEATTEARKTSFRLTET